GAIYKSFATEEEAQSFLKEEELQKNIIERSKNNNYKQLKAYVDGSYSSDKNIYSYGCVLIDGNEITKLSGTEIDSKWLKLRNVASEMLAVMKVVTWAYEHEFDDISIYYDYEGLAKWPTGEWKTNRK